MLITLIMLSDSVLVIIAQYFFETIEDVIKWQQVSERFEKCGKRKESVKYLTVKTLDFNKIIKTVPYVQKLNLGNTAITDIGPLANLVSLQTLDMYGTRTPRNHILVINKPWTTKLNKQTVQTTLR